MRAPEWVRVSVGLARSNPMIIAGGFCVAVIAARLLSIDLGYYHLRDDGVITMSHARNLVEHGFIGVNPSGERVEGFSAPVQFWLFWLYYTLGGSTLTLFSVLQTLAATAVMGMAGYGLVAATGATRRHAATAFAVATLCLAAFSPFIIWHASGMENAITNAALVLVMFVLYRSLETAVVPWVWLLPIAAATLSRLDSIMHVAPLLAIFAIAFRWVHGRSAGALFAAAVLFCWAVYNLWRWHYFGSFTPNTAVAQGIDVVARLKALLADPVTTLSGRTGLTGSVMLANGALFIVLGAVATAVAGRSWRPVVLFAFLASLVLSVWASFQIVGFPTLDRARTTSFLVPSAAYLCAALVGLVLIRRSQWPWMRAAAGAAMASGIGAISYMPPYKVCCSVQQPDIIRVRFLTVAEAHALPRPLVMNPDLGGMSWRKQFNILDAGWLGSSLTARLRNDERLADFMLDLALPDLIELHHGWIDRYQVVLDDPRFASLYSQLSLQDYGIGEADGLRAEYWMRRAVQVAAPTAERAFIDTMTATPTLATVRDESDTCAGDNRELGAECAYIARTVYRLAPELRASGAFDDVATLLLGRGMSAYGRFLIQGSENALAYEGVLKALTNGTHLLPE